VTVPDASSSAARPGEIRFDGPAPAYEDAGLTFIGRIRSPWTDRKTCPKNRRAALEAKQPAVLEVDAPWREALAGLKAGDWIFCLTWLDRAERDLALQVPRHADGPRGTFSLRSPVRPNPIGLHLTQITGLDAPSGRLEIDAIDVLEATPLLDIKPFHGTVDVPSPVQSD
jgi:tRNA-Thr(GGU) m(6)t(6)A37 methyltransferase TsaA